VLGKISLGLVLAGLAPGMALAGQDYVLTVKNGTADLVEMTVAHSTDWYLQETVTGRRAAPGETRIFKSEEDEFIKGFPARLWREAWGGHAHELKLEFYSRQYGGNRIVEIASDTGHSPGQKVWISCDGQKLTKHKTSPNSPQIPVTLEVDFTGAGMVCR
jgi:hypothetical protein